MADSRPEASGQVVTTGEARAQQGPLAEQPKLATGPWTNGLVLVNVDQRRRALERGPFKVGDARCQGMTRCSHVFLDLSASWVGFARIGILVLVSSPTRRFHSEPLLRSRSDQHPLPYITAACVCLHSPFFPTHARLRHPPSPCRLTSQIFEVATPARHACHFRRRDHAALRYQIAPSPVICKRQRASRDHVSDTATAPSAPCRGFLGAGRAGSLRN